MLEQIPTEVKAAVNGNTTIKAAGWLQSKDAEMMAREMRTRGETIQDLNPLEWIFFVNSAADARKAVKVRVPFGTLEKMPKINPDGISWTSQAQTFEDYEKEYPYDEDDYSEYDEDQDYETYESPSEPEPSRAQTVPPPEPIKPPDRPKPGKGGRKDW
jgi:hypothetical protein